MTARRPKQFPCLQSRVSSLENHPTQFPSLQSPVSSFQNSLQSPVSSFQNSFQYRVSSLQNGFTLTELLVVVGIIVLIVTIAVPAFNAIAGNRSIDAAQNQLAAIIGRARQEAIGLQQSCGVIMFQDPNTSRTCVAEVIVPDPSNSRVLGLAPNHDELLLPPGVSFRMIETTTSANTGSGSSSYYSSMNVIMFNSRGEFFCMQWAVLYSPLTPTYTGPLPNPNPPATPPPNPASVALGMRILPMQSPPQNMTQPFTEPLQLSEAGTTVPAQVWVDANSVLNGAYGTSAFGVVLFPDEGAYQNAFAQNPQTTYLTDTGISFLINKYNGTLLRSE